MAENETPAPTPTPEERDAASAAKYREQLEGGTVGEEIADEAPEVPQRPEHIPEKFWDAEKGEVRVEDLAKSYAELEKSKGTPPDPKETEGGDGGDNPVLAEFAALREQAGEKLAAGEELTPEMYEQFEKKHGLSRADVDAFIEGQKAIGALKAQRIHGEVGGEESYKAMIEWAKSAYSKEEVAAYDRDIYSQDEAVRLNAVRGLAARYEQANGKLGVDVTRRGSGSSTSTTGYASGAEMRSDMRDPKYKKDPAFRAEVARKAAAARAAGVDLAL